MPVTSVSLLIWREDKYRVIELESIAKLSKCFKAFDSLLA